MGMFTNDMYGANTALSDISLGINKSNKLAEENMRISEKRRIEDLDYQKRLRRDKLLQDLIANHVLESDAVSTSVYHDKLVVHADDNYYEYSIYDNYVTGKRILDENEYKMLDAEYTIYELLELLDHKIDEVLRLRNLISYHDYDLIETYEIIHKRSDIKSTIIDNIDHIQETLINALYGSNSQFSYMFDFKERNNIANVIYLIVKAAYEYKKLDGEYNGSLEPREWGLSPYGLVIWRDML